MRGVIEVAVAVWIEAEPGGGADFEQRHGLGQTREDGEQHGTAPRLVGLGPTPERNVGDGGPLGE